VRKFFKLIRQGYLRDHFSEEDIQPIRDATNSKDKQGSKYDKLISKYNTKEMTKFFSTGSNREMFERAYERLKIIIDVKRDPHLS
jgi:hypothetical protein